MKSDDGISEVLGFVLILLLITLLAAVLTAGVLPNQIKAEETEHREEITAAFAELKSGMETLSLAEKPGASGEIVLEKTTGSTRLSLAYGKILGNGFREAVLTYEAEQVFAGDFRVSLSGDGLELNGKQIIPALFCIAVDSETTGEQLESTGTYRISYTYLGSFPHSEENIPVFSLRLS